MTNSAEPAVRQQTTPSLADLPDQVRQRILGWAAQTLSGLPPAQTPAALLRVARFTPAKRARLGQPALAAAIDGDSAFRAQVAEWTNAVDASAAQQGTKLDSVEDTGLTSGTEGSRDLVTAAARAFLLRLPDLDTLLVAAGEQAADADQRTSIGRLRREVDRLTDRLAARTVERDEALRAANQGAAEPSADLDRLRQRLRDQGVRLRTLEQLQLEASTAHETELSDLRRQLLEANSAAASWQQRAAGGEARADRAQEALARLRESGPKSRATADRRLELLLATVEGAAAGLRREWDLAGGGPDPADVVAQALPAARPTTERTNDPARLGSWLSLPAAHLIVDGYNVTKTGYPNLTLAQQRERLVRLLAAVSARTSVEVTVVFDGAAVTVPQPPGRGIRVLFSPVGIIADDVIRDLVSAEPSGRVIIVVSTDREVADGAARRGAMTAPSGVLLALLGATVS